MNASPQSRWLDDGRLHLHHGPIDLIIEAKGRGDEAERAYTAARTRFASVLEELVGELGDLRRPLRAGTRFRGPIARRMAGSVVRFSDHFVTPMAAVAGAVADEIVAAMTGAAALEKAWVNNGGDIAFHLAPGESLRVGLVAGDPAAVRSLAGAGFAEIAADDWVRGIATSGRHGRSFSRGIADAVTVLAKDAALADAAATLIANAVDVDAASIERVPARRLDPDSDLGDRPVTVAVGALTPDEIETALERGRACAQQFRARGLIAAASLALMGRRRVVAGAAGRETSLPASGPSLSFGRTQAFVESGAKRQQGGTQSCERILQP